MLPRPGVLVEHCVICLQGITHDKWPQVHCIIYIIVLERSKFVEGTRKYSKHLRPKEGLQKVLPKRKHKSTNSGMKWHKNSYVAQVSGMRKLLGYKTYYVIKSLYDFRICQCSLFVSSGLSHIHKWKLFD